MVRNFNDMVTAGVFCCLDTRHILPAAKKKLIKLKGAKHFFKCWANFPQSRTLS